MKMRKIFAIMLLAATALGFGSCSDDDDNTVDNGMRTGNATKIELTKDAEPVSALQFSIGKGSVIGSNVFITSSVRPGTRMSVKTQELVIRHKDDLEDLGEEKLSKTENDSSGKTINEMIDVPREETDPEGKTENWY